MNHHTRLSSARTRTNASAVAGAIALSLAALSSNAQAQVTLYGTIDLAVGRISTQPPGAPNAPIITVNGVHSGGLQTSYFGMRGTEDLGSGLTAKFQLEGFFRADTGAVGRFDASPGGGADHFWSRETFVGLSGGFGEVRLGNNAHPTWVSMLMTSSMGGNSVFSPSFRQLFNGGARGLSESDTAMVNSVRYMSPNFGGLDGTVVVQAAEGTGSASYSGNLVYRAGPLLASAAHSRIRNAASPNLPGLRDQTITLVGAAYSIDPVRVFAQYTDVKNARTKRNDKLAHVGVAAKLGSGELQVSYGEDKYSGSAVGKRKTTSGGYVYNLSKRTDLYTFAMSDKVSSGDAKSFVVGVRHRF